MNVFFVIWNFFLAFASYFICRIIYILQNIDLIKPENLDLWKAFCGSFIFDNAAICYTLGIYAFLMLLPLSLRNRNWYQTLCKAYYMAVSSLSVIANLADGVYYPYAARRTTTATLLEFQNESAANITKIIAIETLRNWYLVLIAAALIAALFFLYKKGGDIKKPRPAYRIASVFVCLAVLVLTFAGMRGGFTRQTRPINIGNAMRYVNTPAQAAAILNTPFTIIRNLSNSGYTIDDPMTEDEVRSRFSAVHNPCKPRWKGETKPNIVIIIVESLSQEFIGAYNDYPCGTAFIDSLRSVGLSPAEAFANGNKSIDALPSVLSSVPRLEEHLLLTPYANNEFNSLATELGRQGYSSAFFHGASAGSMGFDAFTSAVGFGKSYSYDDYRKDKRFNGKKDFDGQWAVWDEEFLQYTALHFSDLKEPFLTTVFTASSHHPFVIPAKYREKFNRPGNPMYNCISYLDYSLQRFFRTASAQPWYQNTIFVITADHTSTVTEQERYLEDPLGDYRIPIILFDPSGTLPRGIIDRTSQQTDIFPTLMGITGTDREYIAFGKDILDSDSGDWAYIYNETHTVCNADSLFRKALIQDYKSRMISNRMKIIQ